MKAIGNIVLPIIDGLAPIVAGAVKLIAGRPTTDEEAKEALRELLADQLPSLNVDRERLKDIAEGE